MKSWSADKSYNDRLTQGALFGWCVINVGIVVLAIYLVLT